VRLAPFIDKASIHPIQLTFHREPLSGTEESMIICTVSHGEPSLRVG